MPRPSPRNSEPYIEIDGTKFPLVVDGGGNPAEIQRRPLTQFAGVNAIGPNERPAKNPALSSITFAAQTGRGMGTYKHAVLDGIDTFLYSRGFDTRFPGGIVPTPAVDSLTICPIDARTPPFDAWVTAVPTKATHVRGLNGANGIYWYNGSVTELYFYNIVAGTWSTITNGASHVLPWGPYIVRITASGQDISTCVPSSDFTTFTTRDTSNWVGLAAYANRLWSMNGNQLYSCTDPSLSIGGGSGAWTAQGEALSSLQTGEAVRDLVVYRDKGGSPALFVATDYRLIGFDDDSGEWEEYDSVLTAAPDSSHLLAHQWMRDKTLYAIPFGATGAAQRHVYQFVGNTDEVGPTERGGFATANLNGGGVLTQFEAFMALSGNIHWLYAAARGNDVHTAGEVVAYNDLGGWHTVYHPTPWTETNPIIGLCAVGADVYTMFEDGTFKVIRDRDEMTAAGLRYTTGEIAGGTAYINLGKTDVGLPNHEKVGATIRLSLFERTALPTNYEILVQYTTETGLTNSITATSATTFPWEIPLPDGDAEAQDGIPFREITIEAYLYSTSPPMTEAVTIEEVTLYWQKWATPKWARQLVIDLRESTFRKYPNSTFENKGLEVLREELEAIVRVQGYHRIKYGFGPQLVDIKAADLVLAGRESPVDGSGLFPITFRDVTSDV